jgi:hypothetical protein
MATTPTPQPTSEQQSSNPDPVAQFRAWAQAQGSGSQMGPDMSHSQAQQPGQQQKKSTDQGSAYGGKRAAMRDFANNITNIVGSITQKAQARKATDQQQLFDRFTKSASGVFQAKQQMKEAQEALKQNPQDPKALDSMKQAQEAMKTDQGILDAMFNGSHGEKNSKIISKGFGIDDKNADTPFRKDAIQAMQKTMGVGEKAAGILSQIPQTQQQTGPQMKPPTGNAILQSMDKGAGRQQQMAIEQLKQAGQQGASLDKLKMTGTLKGIDVSRGTNGELITHIMSPEERAKVPYLKAQDDATAAKTEAERAMADAKTNPNNPEMRIKMMDAQSNAVRAAAMSQIAQADMMKAMAAKAKEPPEVAQARKTADMMDTEYAKAQEFIKNPSPTNDLSLVASYVRSQNPQARSMSPAQLNEAMRNRSFGARISAKYEEATRGSMDPEFRQEMADSIKISADKARLTAQKYDAQKDKDAGAGDDDPLGIMK